MPFSLKNILIDIFLLLLYGISKFYLGLLFLLVSLDSYYICGNSYLNEYSNIQKTFILLIIIFIIEIAFVVITFKLRTEIFKIGIVMIATTTFFPIIKIGYATTQRSKYYEEFDRNKWLQSDFKPLTMIRSLVDESKLIGKSKPEIIYSLGPGQDSWRIDSTQLYYETDGFLSPLVLTFDNDTLIALTIQCND